MRAELARPRPSGASNFPMRSLPPHEDALAPVQFYVREYMPSLPPEHWCAWLPRSAVMRVPRLRWRPPLLLLLMLLGRCCAP